MELPNKLRHKDYINMLTDFTSLQIVDVILSPTKSEDVEALGLLNVHKRFSDNYTFDDLIIKSATVVLRKETR